MDINQASLQMHYDLHGKIEVISRKKIETRGSFPCLYTRRCRALPCDRKGLRAVLQADAPLQPGGGDHKRNCSFRSWRYWSCCRYAGYGRKMRPV